MSESGTTGDTADARRDSARARRGRRRVTTTPPPGSDPAPARAPLTSEPERHGAGENDDRLRADKPPHYA
ncbi:hypothetical protein [Microcella putealis]|uniref:hypothetical protein n=1 Tax=Microcella putealis TaxID=337005 RepID=UPI00102C4519|nr:hypothetical protein [Microcella putealis]